MSLLLHCFSYGCCPPPFNSWHWKSHNNAYPKLIKLPPDELRHFNHVNSFDKPNQIWGVPIESTPGSTGVMIAVDGTEMELVAGY